MADVNHVLPLNTKIALKKDVYQTHATSISSLSRLVFVKHVKNSLIRMIQANHVFQILAMTVKSYLKQAFVKTVLHLLSQ